MASQLNWTARPGSAGSIASGLASGPVTASRGRAGADPGEHGSLEGVGGLKTNEAYHSKADALLIPEMYFFLKIYLRPFLEMFVL